MNAIIKAKERGIEIRILTDKLQSKGKHSKIHYLREKGINIKLNNTKKYKIEHNKFAIFDKKTSRDGKLQPNQ